MSFALALAALRRNPFTPITAASASLAQVLGLARRAVRRHPVSIPCTTVLVSLSASLLGLSVPLAVLVWMVVSLLNLEALRALEPFVLKRLGCRLPSRVERERLDQAVGSVGVELLVFDASEPWVGRGLRSVVLSRAMLDLLEDRALGGIVAQAGKLVQAASPAGELVVWSGNVPVVGAWLLGRNLVELGRLLAIAVGASLVVPLAIWPIGFARWAGRGFGAVIVGLFGSALLSSGFAAAGLGLLLAWLIVPGLQRLLSWELRLAEAAADDAVLEAGLGWQLLEALEVLTWASSVAAPRPPLGWLCRQASPFSDRADRIWRKLSQP